MFRNVYKQANDDIKGDRVLLDRVYAMAQAPERKKTPVFKYSFATTAVAAVVIVGAIFANPSIFMDKTEEIKNYESEAILSTEALDEADGVGEKVEDVPLVASMNDGSDNTAIAFEEEKSVKTKLKKKFKAPALQSEAVQEADDAAVIDCDDDAFVSENENMIAIMSLEDEAVDSDDVVENEQLDDQTLMFTLRPDNKESVEEYIEEDAFDKEVWVDADCDDDVAIEEETAVTDSTAYKGKPSGGSGGSGGAVKQEIFSYMYDLGEFSDVAITECFVNIDECIIENAQDAIERAKNECTVDYASVNVAYDPIECMWRVTFSCDDSVNNEQIVYMNSMGVTQMLVYLE